MERRCGFNTKHQSTKPPEQDVGVCCSGTQDIPVLPPIAQRPKELDYTLKKDFTSSTGLAPSEFTSPSETVRAETFNVEQTCCRDSLTTPSRRTSRPALVLNLSLTGYRTQLLYQPSTCPSETNFKIYIGHIQLLLHHIYYYFKILFLINPNMNRFWHCTEPSSVRRRTRAVTALRRQPPVLHLSI